MGSSGGGPAAPSGSATGHAAPRQDENHPTRALLDGLEDGYFELDLAGRFSYGNRALAELLGYLPDELIGLAYQQYTDEETAQRLFRIFNGVFRSGQPVRRLGFELAQRDGSRRAVEISISLIRDQSEQPCGFRGVLRDVSERVRSEQALQASEQQYQALLSAAQRQIRERDLLDQVRAMLARELELETVLKDVVEATAQAFGYTHVSLYLLEGDVLVLRHQVGYEHVIQRVPISQGVSGRVVRTGRPVWLADVRADPAFLAAAEEIVSEVCVPIQSSESVIGTFNLESTGQMRLDEADLRIALQLGQHIGIAVERARLYTALRESEERFGSAFEFASIGVALVSPEGRWIKVNRALCELVGYSAAELATQTFQYITHPDDLDKDMDRVRQMLAGEIQTYQMEKRYFHRSGATVWVLLSVSLVRDRGGSPLYFISQLQDINERKRAELSILRQNTELAALNQLGQALSQLVEPARLLDLIYTVIGQVLDNRNLYIALYDEASDSITFPVYMVEGRHVGRESRITGAGLTEHVIRTGAPLFLPNNVSAGARERGVEPQGRPTNSYLAVPLLIGDKVTGVIGIRDYERENAFDQRHVEILTTIASQASVALENARLFSETRRRAEQLQAVNDVERVVTTTLDIDLLCAQIAQVLHSKLDLPAVAIGLIEGDELVFKVASGDLEHGGTTINMRVKVGPYGITGRVAASGETLLVRDVRLEPRFLPSYLPHTRSELAVPLKTQTAIIGVLNIESDEVDAFSPETIRLVETLASQIAIGMENARLFAETQQLARTDALTGIPNRRHLFETGERELSRARRFGHSLAVLMLDIDRFKQVNDTLGHAVGDQVLRALARCYLNNIRDIDMVGRYGGEEFVVLLVETDSEGARRTAERLRAQAALTVTDSPRGPLSLTISVGVATRVESDDLTALLARADKALYAAKQGGRNRVAYL